MLGHRDSCRSSGMSGSVCGLPGTLQLVLGREDRWMRPPPVCCYGGSNPSAWFCRSEVLVTT